MRHVWIFAVAVMAAGSVRAGAITIAGDTFERSAKQVTLTDTQAHSNTYTFSTESESNAVAEVATLADAKWEDAASDHIELALAVSSSSGTLPSLGSITTICVSGSTVSFNSASRTLGSSAAAAEMANAVNAARSLVSGLGASLAESGGTLTLTIPLP